MQRTAVVAGALVGLGREIARILAEMDYKVAVVYSGNDVAAARFCLETGIPAYACDTSSFSACHKGLAEIELALGTIDILVNVAHAQPDVRAHRMSSDHWSQAIHTNLDALFNLCRQVLPGMRQRQFGRIVNVCPVQGLTGQAHYAAAKAGVLGFSRALALENARKNVTVNAIVPGYCQTEAVLALPKEALHDLVASVPMGRLGKALDVARAVAFLVDEETSYITGTTLAVDGGLGAP